LNHQLDSATFYYELALKIKRNYLDSTGIPYSLNNLAGIYFMQNKIEKGLQCIEESNLIRQKLKDLIGISWNEYALGEFYFNQNDIVKSKIHFNKAYVYALKNSYPDLQSKILKFLSSIYAKQRKFDSAYYVFEKYNQLDDSIYNSQNQKQILELETIYETEKKSSQIKLLNSDNKLKQEELIRKNNAQRFLLLIISLVIIFLAVVIRAFYQKKKANKIILEQKTEVEFQKSEIEKQKHIVFEKQKEILDSINYAKKIQDTILANAIFLKRYLPEHFVFFQPKDIVSGDFYWATKRNNKFYLAVCDSTGHGVPGAFMSLLNIGFLNEAINEKGIELPGDVFNYVRNRLVETISKGEQKDGFDGILLCFNLTDNKITYAAANNAPILITNQKMIELPKDRMPVGKGEKDQPFKNFNLQEIIDKQEEIISIENAEIILYTDGYADQFGGPKEKKFKYKPLNEMLVANTHLSLTEQHTKLKTTFDNWKGDLEQVDDVCVVGVRI
jgi:serine phosphatase RsbU (regulator of sigma subunit)